MAHYVCTAKAIILYGVCMYLYIQPVVSFIKCYLQYLLVGILSSVAYPYEKMIFKIK